MHNLISYRVLLLCLSFQYMEFSAGCRIPSQVVPRNHPPPRIAVPSYNLKPASYVSVGNDVHIFGRRYFNRYQSNNLNSVVFTQGCHASSKILLFEQSPPNSSKVLSKLLFLTKSPTKSSYSIHESFCPELPMFPPIFFKFSPLFLIFFITLSPQYMHCVSAEGPRKSSILLLFFPKSPQKT